MQLENLDGTKKEVLEAEAARNLSYLIGHPSSAEMGKTCSGGFLKENPVTSEAISSRAGLGGAEKVEAAEQIKEEIEGIVRRKKRIRDERETEQRGKKKETKEEEEERVNKSMKR